MSQKPRISMIVALGKRTRVIGRQGGLLWHLPGDLPRFKRLTTGHPIIMGRKTWLSLPEERRPLPNRTNIVITTSDMEVPEGVLIAHSPEEALELAKEAPGGEHIFIIGGGKVYEDMLAYTDELLVTEVDDNPEGDTYFPDYGEFTKVVDEEAHPEHTPSFTYRTLTR